MRSQIKILEEEVLRFKVSVSSPPNVERAESRLFPSSDSKPTLNDDTSGSKRLCSVIYVHLAASYSGLRARRRHRCTMDP